LKLTEEPPDAVPVLYERRYPGQRLAAGRR
jgi:hypothetical protein